MILTPEQITLIEETLLLLNIRYGKGRIERVVWQVSSWEHIKHGFCECALQFGTDYAKFYVRDSKVYFRGHKVNFNYGNRVR